MFVHLNQTPGTYYFRASALATGDMVQIIQGQAIVIYGNNETVGTVGEPYMSINGSAKSDSVVLNESALNPFPPLPPPSVADVSFHFTINQTEPTVWVINSQPFVDPVVPILFGNTSDGWHANTTYFAPLNATIDLVISIANDSLDTMGHPLHLHGHTFWTLGTGTGAFDASKLNLVNPPIRDTEGIPTSGWLAIRYVADNPGAWIFHCHIDW